MLKKQAQKVIQKQELLDRLSITKKQK